MGARRRRGCCGDGQSGDGLMGYDVHITRKKNWCDQDGPEIPLAEWTSIVRSDQEMRLDGYAETKLEDGRILRTENEGLTVWTGYSRQGENGNLAWFVFRNGNIVVKNPDSEILQKMWSLAQVLSAKVQGDDDEVYDAFGNPVGMRPPKPWWRFW
jgi:hypothetical protein